jgi:hypothetical protein
MEVILVILCLNIRSRYESITAVARLIFGCLQN